VESPDKFVEISFEVFPRAVDSVSLDSASATLTVGDTKTLVATVLPAAASNKTLTWSSSANDVATVDQSGKVTAIKAGTATITAAAQDGSLETATATITVNAKQQNTPPGAKSVTSVAINGGATAYSFKATGANTMQHTVAVAPSDATNKAVTWTSSDVSIATVDNTGLVTFKGKEGSVTITAKASDGSNKTHSKTITVVKNVTKIRTPLTKINVSAKKKVLLPIVLDDGKIVITGSKLTYKSSKPKVATVDAKGNVKGVKAGKAKITVTAANGKKVAVAVTVSKKAVKLKKFTVTAPKSLKIGKTKDLKVKLTQKKATNLKVTFKSSKPKILSVDKAGRISALKKGKAVITIKAGGKTVKTKKITVK
jgi:alpha-L-fucosidase 2